MFTSQNLFKSITCPYFAQTTNTNTCERPYCPFKHSVQYETVPGSIAEKTDTQMGSSSSSAARNDPTGSKLGELPNVLENLSNALQTIQDFIKNSTGIGAVDSSSNDSNVNILSKLSNISSALLNSVPTSASQAANQPKTNEARKNSDPDSSLKRQKSAPDYNPTPINELKKLKQTEIVQSDDLRSVSSDLECKPKRKIAAADSPPRVHASKSEEVLSHAARIEKPPKPKVEESGEKYTKRLRTSEAEESDCEKKKPSCDITTFSKLSLSQQVLKRYEMLNKPVPTQNQLAEAKLKKKLSELSGDKGAVAGDRQSNPNTPQLIIDPSSSQRIPLVMRQKHLKVIFDNTRPLYKDLKEAATKSSESEKSVYDRAKNKTIYINLVANLIKSLRTQMGEKQQETSQASSSSSQNPSVYKFNKSNPNPTPQSSGFSHEMILSGPKATRVNYSIGKAKSLEIGDLSVTQLYQMFYSYILNEKQLTENSFPQWMKDELGQKLVFIPNFSKQASKPQPQPKHQPMNPDDASSVIIIKNCKRCKSTFSLIQTASSPIRRYASTNSECVFHWGKLRSMRFDKAVEQRYSCCSGGLTSEGCEVGKHVYDGDYDGNGTGKNITGYVETRQPDTSEKLLNAKTSNNIFALDCEMCYTSHGLELARVSIVDVKLKDVYEALVKPEAEILDYNTRWSGLNEQSYAQPNDAKTLRQVQSDLLGMFNTDTILIGHSLESDFKALKLVHSCVVDTSVVFPHKAGPPLKRALRNLMSEYLQKIIQEDVDGHDSKEDATSCVQLMLWKIQQDLKSKKPSLSYSSSASTMPTTSNPQTKSNPQNSIYKVNNLAKSESARKMQIVASTSNPDSVQDPKSKNPKFKNLNNNDSPGRKLPFKTPLIN